VGSGQVGSAEFVEYLMTSQTWRGIPWKHQLFVLRPSKLSKGVRHGLLFVGGGGWKPEYEGERKQAALPGEALLFARLAEAIAAPVAVLRQVPFQPLFERTEDALIAYTFDQYLKSGEDDWPLLLPMVKSAVRAMDALQSTVTGASKRGWTAWLTAATDKRVMAVAPMVIDVLNMRPQLDHQRATWGGLSDKIGDYTAIDLPARLATERGEALLATVDPFRYRERLTQPKLILLGTNDRYWPLDSLKLYWPELPNPKHVLYVPNQGHSLRDIERVIGGVSAVHRYAAAGKPLPQTAWSFSGRPDTLGIHVTADRPTGGTLIWSAHSPTLDFREARSTSSKCAKTYGAYTCSVTRAKDGYMAVFAETSFQDEGAPPFSTTTTLCIASPRVNEALDC
jgi:PhoPQ-activated pathogenicity-related protein